MKCGKTLPKMWLSLVHTVSTRHYAIKFSARHPGCVSFFFSRRSQLLAAMSSPTPPLSHRASPTTSDQKRTGSNCRGVPSTASSRPDIRDVRQLLGRRDCSPKDVICHSDGRRRSRPSDPSVAGSVMYVYTAALNAVVDDVDENR